MAIVPVILAGGSGTRLWPAARESVPKQFQSFGLPASMLRQTLGRLSNDERFSAPIVSSGADHRAILSREVGGAVTSAIILEPVKRNTAPAVAAAALIAQRKLGDAAVIAVVPVDHAIRDDAAFRDAIAAAAQAAERDVLVVVGVTPSRPETGYGYIELGEPVVAVCAVRRFVEKPDAETAKAFVASPSFLWNAGVVVARASVLLEEMAAHCADVLDPVRASVMKATVDQDYHLLDSAAFGQATAISLDYALLEKSRRIVALRGDFAWSDIGTWATLWSAQTADARGNVVSGPVRAEDCHDSYISNDRGSLVALGLNKMVVVRNGDAMLVAPMNRAQDVSRLLGRDAVDKDEPSNRVHRPWGYMDYLEAGDGFQVKRLVLKPGGATSLQLHKHRAEHMTVVRGSARITRDDEVHLLRAGQSIDVPLGARHRLENPGAEEAQLIEVWLGDELREDDIVRLEDRYGRC